MVSHLGATSRANLIVRFSVEISFGASMCFNEYVLNDIMNLELKGYIEFERNYLVRP